MPPKKCEDSFVTTCITSVCLRIRFMRRCEFSFGKASTASEHCATETNVFRRCCMRGKIKINMLQIQSSLGYVEMLYRSRFLLKERENLVIDGLAFNIWTLALGIYVLLT